MTKDKLAMAKDEKCITVKYRKNYQKTENSGNMTSKIIM
jgi:hypothetical protein